MKLFLFLTAFLFITSPPSADPVDKTMSLLKDGSWTELYKTLSNKVDLTLMDEGNVYPKDKAQELLNIFFTKNGPFAVKVVHRVDSNPELKFAVVVLSGKSGSYRTSFSLRNNNGTFEISEMRIEAEKLK
jgi:hypothetical protein